MKTDDLIASLSEQATPVKPGAVGRRIAAGLGVGVVVSVAIMLAWLGPRGDIATALMTPMFWMKFGYAAATGLIAAGLLSRLSRPGVRVGALAALVAIPFALVALMAAMRMANAPPESQHALLMGSSYTHCPWRILLIGLPVLAGAVWAVRGLAPTQLLPAGLAAGACAGGIGAAVYSIACGETAAPFLAIWYTLGMMLLAALGALLGPRLLRWR